MHITLPTAIITARQQQHRRHASNDPSAMCQCDPHMMHPLTPLHARHSRHPLITNPPSAQEPNTWQCSDSNRSLVHHPGYSRHTTRTVVQYDALIAMRHSTSETIGETHVFNT